MYWGKIDLLEGKSWRGLRWLGVYGQDVGPLENPIAYQLEAITSDGRYVILFSKDVEFLNPPRELTRLSDKQVRELDKPGPLKAFQLRVTDALTAARPESFRPDLSQLDAAVLSLELH